MASPSRAFTFDRRLARYRDAGTGRLVPATRVRSYLDDALASAGKRMDALANQLRAGQIDVITWEVRMRREVKIVSTYSGALAKGGWAQMTDADYGRVGQYVRGQYQYLRGFAQRIASGKAPLNGNINNVARLYAEAGRPLFARMEQVEQVLRGMTQRLSVKHSLDSCPGCLAAEAAGWHNIAGSTVPEIGARDCRTRCKCSWIYRNGEQNG